MISIPPASGPSPAVEPTNDIWENLGGLENASAPLATGGQPLKKTGYRAPRSKRSLPSWLLPVGLVGGGIAVVGLLAVFVVSFISGFSSAVEKASDDQLANWETFDHPSGGFSIAMPGHVNASDKQTPMETRSFCSRMLDAYSRSSDGTLVSVVLCTDVVPSPKGTPRDQQYGESLWGSAPDVVSSRVEMFGQPGLEYKGTVKDDGKTRWICSRVILLDDRLYEVSLQRKSGEPMPADQLGTFFATFQPSDLNK